MDYGLKITLNFVGRKKKRWTTKFLVNTKRV